MQRERNIVATGIGLYVLYIVISNLYTHLCIAICNYSTISICLTLRCNDEISKAKQMPESSCATVMEAILCTFEIQFTHEMCVFVCVYECRNAFINQATIQMQKEIHFVHL